MPHVLDAPPVCLDIFWVPLCLDVPCMFGHPICMDTLLYVWMPAYIWMPPCMLGTTYVWMPPCMFG